MEGGLPLREGMREVRTVALPLSIVISVILWPKVKGIRENSKPGEKQIKYANRFTKS